MAVLFVPHYFQALDGSGNPLSGGKLYTYEAGTTTPKATYTTAAGTTPNANPVVLDSAGRATIFLDGSYKFTLKTSADVLVEETDNVTAFTTGGSVSFSSYSAVSPATNDYALIGDTSDSGNAKKALLSDIVALATASAVTVVTSGSFSGASQVDFTSIGSYKFYTLVLTSAYYSPSDVSLRMRLSTDNGSSFITTSAYYQYNELQSGASTVTATGGDDTAFRLGGLSDSSSDLSSKVIDILGMNTSNSRCGVTSRIPVYGSAGYTLYSGNTHTNDGNYNAFRIYPASGTFTGSYKLYGWN